MKIDNVNVGGFYKAIVVEPDVFESKITDEKHFKTKQEAMQFQSEQSNEGRFCFVVHMVI